MKGGWNDNTVIVEKQIIMKCEWTSGTPVGSKIRICCVSFWPAIIAVLSNFGKDGVNEVLALQ